MNDQSNSIEYSRRAAATDFAEKISASFDVVCFDLDQCAVCAHSRGSLLRNNLDDFASKISADFVLAVPALLERKVQLAIVTHSDLAQHSSVEKPRRGDGAVVLGDDLVHEVLLRVLPEYAHELFVVAWRPKSRGIDGEKDPGKLRHMRACAAFYNVPLERCVLFDDDATNCSLTSLENGSEFSAFRCDPELGFRFSDFVERDRSTPVIQDDYFTTNGDGTIDRLGRWVGKWNNEYDRKPRFHLPVVNPNLTKYYGTTFCPPKDLPILLPLCGKTIDLKWLLKDCGHHWVVGVEGVRKAIEELRDEMLEDLELDSAVRADSVKIYTTAAEENSWFPQSEELSPSNKHSVGTISVMLADFFGLSPESFTGLSSPCFGAIYDRASIVAIPPHSRPEYVDVIDSLLIPGGQILMITVDSKRKTGPPYPVTSGVVEELFATRDYSVQLLEEHDADFGNDAKEYVFLLSKQARKPKSSTHD